MYLIDCFQNLKKNVKSKDFQAFSEISAVVYKNKSKQKVNQIADWTVSK